MSSSSSPKRGRLIEAWRLNYNHYQPHSSLRVLTPSEFAALKRTGNITLQEGEITSNSTHKWRKLGASHRRPRNALFDRPMIQNIDQCPA